MSFRDEVENIIGHYPECDYNLSKGKDLCDCYAGETAQSIINLVEQEVIMSDEDRFADVPDYAMMKPVYQIRNKLRAEQRAKLKGDK